MAPMDSHEALRRSLLDIPERTIAGDLTSEHAYLLERACCASSSPFTLPLLGVELTFHGNRIEFERMVPRIHHRSGILGVIAEWDSRSNFIGAGIRVDLR